MSILNWKYEKFHGIFKGPSKYVDKMIENSEKKYIRNRKVKVRNQLDRLAKLYELENAYVSINGERVRIDI